MSHSPPRIQVSSTLSSTFFLSTRPDLHYTLFWVSYIATGSYPMLLIAIEGTQGFPCPLHSNTFQLPLSLMAVNGLPHSAHPDPQAQVALEAGFTSCPISSRRRFFSYQLQLEKAGSRALSAVWPKWSLCNLCQTVCCACALCPTSSARAVSGSCSGWSGQVGVGRLQAHGTSHLVLLAWDGGPGSCSILLR